METYDALQLEQHSNRCGDEFLSSLKFLYFSERGCNIINKGLEKIKIAKLRTVHAKKIETQFDFHSMPHTAFPLQICVLGLRAVEQDFAEEQS